MSKNNWIELPTETIFKQYANLLKELWNSRVFSLDIVKGYRNAKTGKEKIFVGKKKIKKRKRGDN